MTIQSQAVIDPQLVDALQRLKTDIFRSLNCVKVGKIQKFDVTKKTAQVQVLFKRVLADESTQSVPLLLDCPVFTLQGGGASVRLPIAAGDHCLVVFSDRNLDRWFQNGDEGAPYTGRCHDLSDGIALVGLNSLASALAAYSTNEAFFDYAGAHFGLKGGKATVKNGSTDLLTLLNGLIDQISAITITDPQGGTGTVSAASQAILTAYKATLGGLLYS